ncbi:MAG: hypothetical protein HXX08_09040 [Chloroflexi bacterium]|uniref:Uncharacterized protein n=1 Tax=Candidatus Chlorohelix allophototropha TaxID=3003348 RepID=A0A8T7M1J8_9CHLR|nr:hypothetical protein [Chloroflexota bacterium]WJW67869.1 hypothetical protein OZ401_001152 [Chloroflexota bacterium L227-S17]
MPRKSFKEYQREGTPRSRMRYKAWQQTQLTLWFNQRLETLRKEAVEAFWAANSTGEGEPIPAELVEKLESIEQKAEAIAGLEVEIFQASEHGCSACASHGAAFAWENESSRCEEIAQRILAELGEYSPEK